MTTATVLDRTRTAAVIKHELSARVGCLRGLNRAPVLAQIVSIP